MASSTQSWPIPDGLQRLTPRWRVNPAEEEEFPEFYLNPESTRGPNWLKTFSPKMQKESGTAASDSAMGKDSNEDSDDDTTFDSDTETESDEDSDSDDDDIRMMILTLTIQIVMTQTILTMTILMMTIQMMMIQMIQTPPSPP